METYPDFHYFHRQGTDELTFLLLHGTGGDERDLVPLADAVAPGCSILSPRGQVSEHGALRFFRRFAEGVLDIEDWKNRSDHLADFVRKEIEKETVPGKRVIALGYSNGANIAQGLLLQHPDILAGAILLRPMFVAEPVAPAAGEGKRILILAGESDPLMPPGDPEKLKTLYQSREFEVTLKLMAGGHGLSQSDLQAAREWL
jgi:phospholipase/carboxylesterase